MLGFASGASFWSVVWASFVPGWGVLSRVVPTGAMDSIDPPWICDAFLPSGRLWLPYKRWSNRKVIFVRASEVQSGSDVIAKVVDIASPLELGSDKRVLQPKTCDDEVIISGHLPRMTVGQVYMLFGCSCPISVDHRWQLQVPKALVFGVLGWSRHDVPTDIRQRMKLEGPPLMKALSPVPEGSPGLPAQDSTHSDCQWGAFRKVRGSEQCGTRISHQTTRQTKTDGPLPLPTPPTGFVDLDGRFHVMALPAPDQVWPQWIAHACPIPAHMMQATIDGVVVDPAAPLPNRGFILRLRGLLRGGVKPRHDLQKLIAHLVQKGVAAEDAPERAKAVADLIGIDKVQSAYNALDPWKSLKEACGTRMRLVTQEEVRQLRAKMKQTKGTPAVASSSVADPWIEGDPWSKALAEKKGPSLQEVQVSLASGFFFDQSGSELPVLAQLGCGARGVVLASRADVEMFARMNGTSSDDALGAVVLGSDVPSTGALRCTPITLPVLHGPDQNKLLVRGSLVDFGVVQVKAGPEALRFSLQPSDSKVMSVEIRREYFPSWQDVVDNPLQVARGALEGFQQAVQATWTRKYFLRSKPSSAQEASSWHCFARVCSAAAEKLLKQSGQQGIFLVPKESDAADFAGRFRVVWLETSELAKAVSIQKANAESFGLVRGKSCLGLRVLASSYRVVRQRLDPLWTPTEEHLDIVVSRKWSMSPLPYGTDRSALQALLTEMSWRAVPLRQIGGSTWLIGSEANSEPSSDTVHFSGHLVLIVEQVPRKQRGAHETVVAGPPSAKKALDKQIAVSGPSLVPVAIPAPAVSSATAGPTRLLVGELKEEVNHQLQDVSQQLQQVRDEFQRALASMSNRIEQTEASVAEQNAEARELVQHATAQQLQHDDRLKRLETTVTQLSAHVATKEDVAAALNEVMNKQCAELRSMLSKRPSPDGSPTAKNDPKAPKLNS